MRLSTYCLPPHPLDLCDWPLLVMSLPEPLCYVVPPLPAQVGEVRLLGPPAGQHHGGDEEAGAPQELGVDAPGGAVRGELVPKGADHRGAVDVVLEGEDSV